MPILHSVPGGLEARCYDYFRDRVLCGRQQLVDDLTVEPRSVWVELGAGTGRTVDFLGDALTRLERLYLVDPTRPLLDLAQRRCGQLTNVTLVNAHAARTGLPDRIADVVVCSYVLTAISDWRATIDEARRLLGPGGWIGVVDFHRPGSAAMCVPGPEVRPQCLPESEQLDYLHERFRLVSLEQALGPLPGMPDVGTPFYRFIGAR
jgi:S-adenosylmethionine-diacylgycerolhomoserine-N-methlytransferase